MTYLQLTASGEAESNQNRDLVGLSAFLLGDPQDSLVLWVLFPPKDYLVPSSSHTSERACTGDSAGNILGNTPPPRRPPYACSRLAGSKKQLLCRLDIHNFHPIPPLAPGRVHDGCCGAPTCKSTPRPPARPRPLAPARPPARTHVST